MAQMGSVCLTYFILGSKFNELLYITFHEMTLNYSWMGVTIKELLFVTVKVNLSGYHVCVLLVFYCLFFKHNNETIKKTKPWKAQRREKIQIYGVDKHIKPKMFLEEQSNVSHFSLPLKASGTDVRFFFFSFLCLSVMVIRAIIDNRQTFHFWSRSFMFFIKSIWPPGPYLPSKRKMTQQIWSMMDDGAFI